jgi:hypothetical protein
MVKLSGQTLLEFLYRLEIDKILRREGEAREESGEERRLRRCRSYVR